MQWLEWIIEKLERRESVTVLMEKEREKKYKENKKNYEKDKKIQNKIKKRKKTTL